MSRLAGAIDGMIGVDTLAAATDPVGGLLAQTSVRADAAGDRRLVDFAQLMAHHRARRQISRPQANRRERSGNAATAGGEDPRLTWSRHHVADLAP